MAKVSSGLEMQLGQIPGQTEIIELMIVLSSHITSNHVCHKERQPADDENSHHRAKCLGRFGFFGDFVEFTILIQGRKDHDFISP